MVKEFLGSDNNRVIVSYWMNLLQSINKSRNFIVTLNPEALLKEELIYRSFPVVIPILMQILLFGSKTTMEITR